MWYNYVICVKIQTWCEMLCIQFFLNGNYSNYFLNVKWCLPFVKGCIGIRVCFCFDPLSCHLCSRTDYFRNFIDSCLQKIPQDRPHSDDMLGVSARTYSTPRHRNREQGQCVKMRDWQSPLVMNLSLMFALCSVPHKLLFWFTNPLLPDSHTHNQNM